MTDVFNNLIGLITDRNKSLRSKIGGLFFILILFVSVDYCTSLTYDLHTNKKLEQIEKVFKLKKETSKDSFYTKEIGKLENEILNDKHYSESFLQFLNISGNHIKNTETYNDINNSLRSFFWMLISIGGLLIFGLPFSIFISFKNDKKLGQSKIKIFKNIIEIIGTTIIYICIWICISYLIPIINSDYIWFNYIINFVLQIIAILVLYYFVKEDTDQYIENALEDSLS